MHGVENSLDTELIINKSEEINGEYSINLEGKLKTPTETIGIESPVEVGSPTFGNANYKLKQASNHLITFIDKFFTN